MHKYMLTHTRRDVGKQSCSEVVPPFNVALPYRFLGCVQFLCGMRAL